MSSMDNACILESWLATDRADWTVTIAVHNTLSAEDAGARADRDAAFAGRHEAVVSWLAHRLVEDVEADDAPVKARCR